MESLLTRDEAYRWLGACSSCAIEGNDLAAIHAETLRRILNGEEVGAVYLNLLYATMGIGRHSKSTGE